METDLGLELLGGKRQFQEFSESGGKWATPFPKSRLCRHLNPDELARVSLELLGRDTLNSLRGMKAKELAPHVGKLAAAGFTESEIVRVTGLGKSVVHRTRK